ncbi:KIR-like protein [Plasmodium coatneyi]|uniref:KIR-like protein n=1 Tax=Plasmodium coatneyi TaxID=208452 RepID=A0A1B1E7F4_9APIC|nr:KIR-like protein [Plasmodium coatneyi]ANQ10913.1 KIR-like protein [Plasmodium coatneyi]
MSDTAPLNPSNERSFPSYKNFYEKFESSKETKCTDSDPCGREVETYGLNSRNLRRHEAKIKSALAYIYKEYRTNKKSPESEARHFLYYWLGDKISKNAIEAKPNFHTAIRLICSAINSPPEKESCEIPCDNPTEAIFPHRKKIFDYTYDYDTIEKDLQTDDSDCKGKWSSYLEEIDKACTAVRGDCTTKTNPGEKEYCEKFEATYGVYCKAAKLPKMQCELKSTQEKMEREGQSAASRAEAELNEAVRSATTTSSLSSIIGTLGFTIAPFLLYKPTDPTSFPSYKDFYQEFKDSKETQCDNGNGCSTEVQQYSLGTKGLGGHEFHVQKALAYLLKTYGDKGSKKSLECTARHFFYYWLGDIISNGNWKSSNFPADISVICRAINQPSGKQPYGIPCDNPDKEIFSKRKAIFDYSYNYSRIKEILENGGPNCNRGWLNYLKDVSIACQDVEKDCAGRKEENEGRVYCEEFKTKYVQYCNTAKLSELKCELKFAQERIANFYNKFEKGAEEYGGNYGQEIKAVIEAGNKFKNYTKQILRALGYVCKVYGESKKPSNNVPYHFLYYWLGEKLSEVKENDSLFGADISNISGKVNNYCAEGNGVVCGIPDDRPDRKTFNDMKIIFDFWYDYGAIRTLLENSTPKVVGKCKSYMDAVNNATSGVGTYCHEPTGKNYCQNFWTGQSKEDIEQKLRELYTALELAQQKIAQEAQAASARTDEAVRSATTTSSISSILGTLAVTTALPFFLYKYKLLPSWFGNNSNGRSRKKRSTARNPDTFTEDSLTYDSTDTSTIGSTDLAENSTVRSGVYTTPSTRQSTERTNNAPGRQNIGYQNIKFQGSTNDCAGECRAHLEFSVKPFSGERISENELWRACCALSEVDAQDPYYGERYNFLYYWIGDKLWEQVKSTKGDSGFLGPLNMICKDIQGAHKGGGHKIICESIRSETFHNRKRVHDYSYDYNYVEGVLKDVESNCDPQWSAYLKEVSTACKAVEAKCTAGHEYSKDEYCSAFNNKYRVYCRAAELSKLKCKPPTAEVKDEACSCKDKELQNQQLSNQLSQTQENLRGATTTASITSIFGTLATTALPYLLYKYKPWSSWFGNHSNGGRNRRGKRSAGHEFDTLTYDSTDTSTIGPTESSTVSSSAAKYTKQLARGREGKANNSTPGHRNNVGYSRIRNYPEQVKIK